jgi:hypothetical protein
MAKQLFRLAMNATTSAVPTVNRYLYACTAAVTAATLTVTKTQFVDDTGVAPTAITTAIANNGYYLLYVNGELQQSGIYAVTNAKLTITTTGTFTIPLNGMVALSTTNFAPSTTVTG